jgi:hypothetical protein
MMNRRTFAFALAALVASPTVIAQRLPAIEVHLNPG